MLKSNASSDNLRTLQSTESLDYIQIEQLSELELPNGGGSIPVLIIGNKDDLVDKVFKEQHRQVMAEEDGNNLYIVSFVILLCILIFKEFTKSYNICIWFLSSSKD
jgi:hypothetical protein